MCKRRRSAAKYEIAPIALARNALNAKACNVKTDYTAVQWFHMEHQRFATARDPKYRAEWAVNCGASGRNIGSVSRGRRAEGGKSPDGTDRPPESLT